MNPSSRAENQASDQCPSSRQLSSDDDGESQPAKKRGRRRVSCAECRRLKLKCDRQVPCANCVKRNCAGICPAEARQSSAKSLRPEQSSEQSYLHRRIGQLETIMRERGIHLDQTSDGSPNDPAVTDAALRHTSSSQPPSSSHEITDTGLFQAPVPPSSWTEEATFRPSLMHSPDPVPVVFAAPDLPSVHFDHQLNDTPSSLSTAPAGRISASPHSEHGHGTLVIGEGGRSRWLGPSAGTEWLRNQEHAAVSRAPSDDGDITSALHPFGTNPSRLSTAELYSRLPAEDEGRALAESYRRYFAWNHDPIPRSAFDRMLAQAYPPGYAQPGMHIHQLAALYAVFAIGALLSLEYPPNDPVADEYLMLAESCLCKGNFTVQSTIAGLQALNLIGHFHSESEKGRSGDLAWPLWGLSMKLIQGMGVHRDGTRWSLVAAVVEERRQLFWECHTIDVFQAHCFSRPATMKAKYIDTRFPALADIGKHGSDGQSVPDFKRSKYMLAELFEATLDQAMTVQPPEYEEVTRLYERLCAFEQSIPYHLRCRTALQATPSRYPNREDALRDSGELDRRNLKRTLEQFTLALNVSEAILFLQRPYYVKALFENPEDPTRSAYGQSFLAVVERCNVTTQIVCGLADTFPRVAARHWFYWYHLFTAAVCIGILPLRCTHSPLSPFALDIIGQAIRAYSIAVAENPSPSLVRNHKWLIRLRDKGSDKLQSLFLSGLMPASRASEVEDDDVGLLGWATRLIERGSQGVTDSANTGLSTSRGALPSVGHSSADSMPRREGHPLEAAVDTSSAGLGHPVGQNSAWQDVSFSDGGEEMGQLQQFWDPLLFPDPVSNQPGGLASVNWWAWDGIGGSTAEQPSDLTANDRV